MSAKIWTEVFERSEAKGAARLVLLVLADHAHDDGEGAYPSQGLIARKARMTERGVRKALRDLRDAGEVTAVRIHPQRQTVEYRVTPGGRNDVPGGAQRGRNVVPKGEELRSAKPSKEPSELISGDARARPANYRGKRVPPVVVAEAERLLGVFNEATGRARSPRGSDGSPSPNLRRIIGGLLSRPEVEPDAWESAIRNTVANPPPWVDGTVQLGHVFGEKAADWSLENSGEPGRRNGVDPAKQRRVDRFMDALASFTKEEK